MDDAAICTNPFTISHLEVCVFMTAIRTKFRRREPTINVLDFAASPGLFVRHKVDELRPTSVTYRLCEIAVRHHAFDVQIFKGDQAKFVDQLTAQLMMKVKASIGDLFVGGRYPLGSFLNRLVALVAVDPKLVGFLGFKLAAQTTLANLQSSLGVAVKLGRWNLIVVRQTNEVNQAQVYTDLRIVAAVGGFRCFALALQGNKILAGLVFDTVVFLIVPSSWRWMTALTLPTFGR